MHFKGSQEISVWTSEDSPLILKPRSAADQENAKISTSSSSNQLPLPPNQGSSVSSTVFNFTNSIVGAGCIGLGSAIARSGGLASIAGILFFSFLSKLSYDLIIQLSIETGGSYETLGYETYGALGQIAVMLSKFLYSYGCLVAYIKIIKDNFPSAIQHLILVDTNGHEATWLVNEDIITLILSLCIMFPLCLLRDISPLNRVSIAKIFVVLAILSTLVFLRPSVATQYDTFTNYEKWFEVRPGIVASLGTFVFTFAAQHTVNLAFDSLRTDLKTIGNWKIVSSMSLLLSTLLSLSIGLAPYITFWNETSSDLFSLYFPSRLVALAKLLLSFMMIATYPMPCLSCRELIILSIPLKKSEIPWWLLESKQLILPLHVLVTLLLWATSTTLAILAPSLGDILDLAGCCSATLIAYVLPALFSYKLHGYTATGFLIMLVGGSIGLVGTFLSISKLVTDSK